MKDDPFNPLTVVAFVAVTAVVLWLNFDSLADRPDVWFTYSLVAGLAAGAVGWWVWRAIRR